VTLPSSRAPLPARTQRTRSVTNNGKAFPQYCPASVRSFVTSSDICFPISRCRAAVTSIPSVVQICSTSSPPFAYIHHPCLWDDNTPLHAYSNPQCLSIFHLGTCRPVRRTTFGGTSNWERCLGGQWVRNERALAVEWAVCRWSYQNRIASAASSGLGPSESVEAQGRRMLEIAEFYDKEWYGAGDRDMVIHDGKDASFCRSCRFVCSFIVHLPTFLLTSIFLVRFFFHLITSVFPRIYSSFPECFLILLLLQRNDPAPQTHSLLLRFLRLSQANRDSCHRPLCLLCRTRP
jgi:hypothetical protein